MIRTVLSRHRRGVLRNWAALAALVFAGSAAICASAAGAGEGGKAIERILARQAHPWEGVLFVHKADGSNEIFPLAYELRKVAAGRFEGRLTVKGAQTETGAQPQTLDVVFEVLPAGVWQAKIGGIGDLEGQPIRDFSGKSTTWSALWAGRQSIFQMLLNPEGRDLTISGVFPLPVGLVQEPVWTTVQLHRRGFLFAIGPFEINFWECLGIIGSLLFGVRFLIQLLASERAKRSVTPESFWWVSLVAAFAYTVYGFYFQRIAVVLGQLMGWYVYVRNIILLHREKRPDQRTPEVAENPETVM